MQCPCLCPDERRGVCTLNFSFFVVFSLEGTLSREGCVLQHTFYFPLMRPQGRPTSFTLLTKVSVHQARFLLTNLPLFLRYIETCTKHSSAKLLFPLFYFMLF